MKVAVGALRLAERNLHVYAESRHQMLNLAQEGVAALIRETEAIVAMVAGGVLSCCCSATFGNEPLLRYTGCRVLQKSPAPKDLGYSSVQKFPEFVARLFRGGDFLKRTGTVAMWRLFILKQTIN